MDQFFERAITNLIGRLTQPSRLAAIAIGSAFVTVPATTSAQDSTMLETAKPADSVSPTGVSYVTGSFTYSVPLFSIGSGDWPEKISVSLNYDSASNRLPNSSWSFSSMGRVNGSFIRFFTGYQEEEFPEYHRYNISFVMGKNSNSFEKKNADVTINNYLSSGLDGSKLAYQLYPGQPGYNDYSGGDSGIGKFTYTARDGSKVEVDGQVDNGQLKFGAPSAILTDGKTVEFGYAVPGDTNPYSKSNQGLLVRVGNTQLISSTVYEVTVCAYNLAVSELSQTADCTQSSMVATVRYKRFPDDWKYYATRITRPDGSIYQFLYQKYDDLRGPNVYNGIGLTSKARYHLSCVKEPGQSVCAVSNTYDPCDGPDVNGNGFEDREWSGSRDRVTQQVLADGRVISYAYPGQPAPCRSVPTVVQTEVGSTTTINLIGHPGIRHPPRVVESIQDPIGRSSSYQWTGANPNANYIGRNHLVANFTAPEGNKTEYAYDGRGNVTEMRVKSKTSSGLTDIVFTATYSATCVNEKTCNKPTSMTDAEGNTSIFTYSIDHGGILTKVGPSVNGVSPATKYYYVQREAWLKSGIGYAKTGEPIWLLTEERSCRTTALNLSNGTCASGNNDLVTTTYDYGPDSGPNNLWLRGTAIAADGETLRTCYSYDEFGRKLSETQPKAGLVSCS